MDDVLTVDDAIRKVYRFLRWQRKPLLRAQAYVLYQRHYGPQPTTFVAGRNGTWRFDRVALLAELRLLVLRNFPVGVVSRFDIEGR